MEIRKLPSTSDSSLVVTHKFKVLKRLSEFLSSIGCLGSFKYFWSLVSNSVVGVLHVCRIFFSGI